ncbi:hypothetical protein BD311DRAFT_769649 [Dichomitus squalens]|uniref:Letm1 RBD domain-containing protein n=1 Tax=Dichomitus squalens TaxID=114155 RepID=A0A4Q9M781_9APHY|nr:hypothetical protein BD311DRAFT_769649 [Dichomitus squalens]
MLASLRNGLVDGLTVTRHHRTSAAVRFRARHVHLSTRARDGVSWRVSGAVAVYSRGSRCVSTTPPPPTSSVAKDVPPPAPGAAPRKPKVDLRPGPVKPPKAYPEPSASQKASESAATSLSSGSESIPTPPGGVPPLPSGTVTEIDHSVIQTAKEDYYDASKHGILKPPPEDASWVGKLYHQAKELFKFYWNGVKLINVNRKRVRDIQARVKGGGDPLTRWEARFIANFRQDALKLIPFLLIVLVAEEVIPLVVIYAPFLLPSTCLLPSQKERIDKKKREKQKDFADSMQLVFRDVYKRSVDHPELTVEKLLDRVAAVSYNGIFALSTFGIPSMRLRRIKKHLANIAADDAFLVREHLGERLTADELREALEERGICSVTDQLSTEAMRTRLRWWLAEINQADNDPIRKRIQLVAVNVIGKHDAPA